MVWPLAGLGKLGIESGRQSVYGMATSWPGETRDREWQAAGIQHATRSQTPLLGRET